MSTIPPATAHAASGQKATAGNEATVGQTAADVSPASASGACSNVPLVRGQELPVELVQSLMLADPAGGEAGQNAASQDRDHRRRPVSPHRRADSRPGRS